MEVTQFTYFQQAGGKVLEVPAVEITYGLERILMALQVGGRGWWGRRSGESGLEGERSRAEVESFEGRGMGAWVGDGAVDAAALLGSSCRCAAASPLAVPCRAPSTSRTFGTAKA